MPDTDRDLSFKTIDCHAWDWIQRPRCVTNNVTTTPTACNRIRLEELWPNLIWQFTSACNHRSSSEVRGNDFTTFMKPVYIPTRCLVWTPKRLDVLYCTFYVLCWVFKIVSSYKSECIVQARCFCTVKLFSKSNQLYFWILWSCKQTFLVININILWGDLTGISAENFSMLK